MEEIKLILCFASDSSYLKLLHGDPACSDGAGAGDSVTFALESDEALDGFATRSIVVEVHEVAGIFASFAASFAGVDEQLGELGAIPDVVRTPAPLEHPLLVAPSTPSTVVAFTMLQLAFAAAARDAVDDGGGRDGVDEGSLAGAACWLERGGRRKEGGFD